MSKKKIKMGIKRDPDVLYFIQGNSVYSRPRGQGQPAGKKSKVADIGVKLDHKAYTYFLDKNGDIVGNKRRQSGASREQVNLKVPPGLAIHEQVVLKVSRRKLKAGDLGSITRILDEETFEVNFTTIHGSLWERAILKLKEIRLTEPNDVITVRKIR